MQSKKKKKGLCCIPVLSQPGISDFLLLPLAPPKLTSMASLPRPLIVKTVKIITENSKTFEAALAVHEPSQLIMTNWLQTNWLRTNGFVTVISSQSEGLAKMALGIVKCFCDRPSQPISIVWFAVSLFVVSLLQSVVVDPAVHAAITNRFCKMLQGARASLCCIFLFFVLIFTNHHVLKQVFRNFHTICLWHQFPNYFWYC